MPGFSFAAPPSWLPYAAAITVALLTQLTLLAVTYRAGRRRERQRRPAPATSSTTGSRTRLSRGDLLAAAIATAVSAEGMWETFTALDMPVPLRVATFAFIEIAMLQAARRARRAMLERYRAGADGIAMWVLTCLSALLSVSHEITSPDPNVAVILVRLIAPLVAAWGWERNMALERRRLELPSGINWRITPERILVRFGLAEATDRTASEVDVHRRITRVARSVKRLRTLRTAGAWKWRQERASRRLDRAMEEAAEHAGLATNPARQQAMLAHIGALLNAAGLADLTPPPPWEPLQTAAHSDADRPNACPAPGRLPSGHQLNDEELVHLGFEAARAQQWLAGRGLNLPPADIARALAEAPRPPIRHLAPVPNPDTDPPAPPVSGTAHTGPAATQSRADEPCPHEPGTEKTRTAPTPVQTRTGTSRTSDARTNQSRTYGSKNDRRTDPAAAERTAGNGKTAPLITDERKPREYWVALLVDQIHAAREAGQTWRPDYADLEARSGYRRSWLEKTVAAARTAADQSAESTHTTETARTAQA